MELILIRHGKAEDYHANGDSARELVTKGYEQAKAQALYLKNAKALPEIVLTSPYARARQTAETFCQTAGMPGPISHSWIACGMSPETALEELIGYDEFSRVAIVGHEPDISCTVSYLTGLPIGSLKIRKGSMTCIKISPPARGGILNYMIPAKINP